VLAGGNNITLSQSSNSISIIGAAGGTGGAAMTFGGSNLGNTSGTSGVISGSALQFLLAGGNNVTLSQSLNGSSITITVSAFNQSNQQISAYGVSNTTLSTSGTLNASNLSFEGVGGVSVGVSNGSVVISGGAGGGGGNNTIGMSNLGNTSGTTGVVSGSAVEFFLAGGNNVTLSQSINGSTATVTVSAANQTNQTGNVYASSNTFGTSSGTIDARTLSIAGSGAVSIAASNSGFVVSAPVQTNQSLGLYAVSNTTLSTSHTADARSLSFAGDGIISVGASNGSVQISAVQSNQSLGLYASSQTTGQSSSSSVDARSLSIVGAGAVSIGMSGGSLVVSGATAAAGTLTGYAVSNTTLSTSGSLAGNALSFEGAGNVSVGVSNGSVVISGATAAGATNLSAYAVSNTTQGTSGTLGLSNVSFEGAGAASVGVSNGSIVMSVPAFTTITQGNMVTISTAGSSMTIDAFANILSASGNTSGTLTTFSSGTMVLAGGNNITLSQSSNTITISGASTLPNVSAYAVSNTTLGTSGSLAKSALSFEGAGGVSVGVSNGSVVISGVTGGGATTLGAYAVSNTTLSTSGTLANSAFSFEGAGGVSAGISGGSVVVSAPVQSYLVAGNNISLSSNSNSITISDILTSQTLSQYEPWQFGANSSASSLGQSSLYLQHVNLPDSMQVCRGNKLASISINAAVTGNTNSTGTRSNVWNYNETVGLYTRGAGANSTNLYSYASNSWSFGFTESVSVLTTAATSDVAIQASYTLGFIGHIDTNGGSTSSTFSSASSVTTAATSGTISNPITAVSGVVAINFPFGSALLSAGDYWVAKVGVSAVTSAGTATTLASVSDIVLTNYNSNLKYLGQTATNVTDTIIAGNGVFSANTAAFPSSIAISAINNNSLVSLYGNVINLSL
jgi:hypothetical protein